MKNIIFILCVSALVAGETLLLELTLYCSNPPEKHGHSIVLCLLCVSVESGLRIAHFNLFHKALCFSQVHT